jgi:hypothetical protein
MMNQSKYVSRIKWFCIITLIVTVLTAIILPSLLPFFPMSKVCATSKVKVSSTRLFIGNIPRWQRAYYNEYGHFASSRQELEREYGRLLSGRDLQFVENNWEISIQIKDDIAFAYAIAKNINPNRISYSYVSAITTYGRDDNDQLKWTSTICRTLEPSTAQPAAPMLQESPQFIFWRHDAQLVCSSGTEGCYSEQKLSNWILEVLSKNLSQIRWLHPFNLPGNE